MSRDVDEDAGAPDSDSSPDAPAGALEAEVPPVEELTGDRQTLDRRVQVTWLLGSVVSAIVLGLVAGVAGFFVNVGVWPGLVVGFVTLALGVAHTIVRYRIWNYEVRTDALYLERGVLTRVKTVVPHVRIQHVDASRGPLERTLGLSSVVVYTAGSRGADVTVPGLTRRQAEDLQTRLKHLAIAAEGEDAV